MYEGARLSVKIKGHPYGTTPIRCAVRQRYLMSMAFYALCLHPFLRLLELKLPGIRIGCRSRPISVVDYANDVTLFVTSAADFTTIEEAIHLFKLVSGARLNPRKSKALAVGKWCTQDTFLGIAYHPSMTILGVTFWGTIKAMRETWARLTGKVRTQVKRSYALGPCLENWIRYVNTFLLSKIWYIAQILLALNTYTQQLTTATT